MNKEIKAEELIIVHRKGKGYLTWDQMTDEQKATTRKLIEHWDEIWNKPDDGKDDI